MKCFVLAIFIFFFGDSKAQNEKENLIQKITAINVLGDEEEGLLIDLPDISESNRIPSPHDNYLYFQQLKTLLTKDDFARLETSDTDILRLFIWVDYLKNDSLNKDFFEAFKKELKRQNKLFRVQGCEGVDLFTYDILADEVFERKILSNYFNKYQKFLDSIWVYSLNSRRHLELNFCRNLFKNLQSDKFLVDDIAFQVFEYNNILALHYLLKNDKENFNEVYGYYLSEILPSSKLNYYELDQLYFIAEKMDDVKLKAILRNKFLNIYGG